jgi:hypothetical protein
MEWLTEALADGPLPSDEVYKQGAECGFSHGTLVRAVAELGIQSHKTGFERGWEMRWTPPADTDERFSPWEAVSPFRICRFDEASQPDDGQETAADDHQGDQAQKRHGEQETRRLGEGATEEAIDVPDSCCASSQTDCASSTETGDCGLISCDSSTASCASSASCDSSEGCCDASPAADQSLQKSWCDEILEAVRKAC